MTSTGDADWCGDRISRLSNASSAATPLRRLSRQTDYTQGKRDNSFCSLLIAGVLSPPTFFFTPVCIVVKYKPLAWCTNIEFRISFKHFNYFNSIKLIKRQKTMPVHRTLERSPQTKLTSKGKGQRLCVCKDETKYNEYPKVLPLNLVPSNGYFLSSSQLYLLACLLTFL